MWLFVYKKIGMRTFVMIGMLFCVLCSSAQVKRDSVRVYFRQGKSVVDLRYLNNTSHFSLLAERYRQYSRNPQYWLKGIRIVSSASPEASFSLNDRLSQKRADAVLHFLKSKSWLDGSMLQVQPLGEDWKGLRRLVETDPNVPSREAVLESLERYPDGQEGEWDLKQIADGQSYRYLYNQIYPLLRQTNVVFDVVQERELQYPGRISFKRDMVMPEKRLSVSHELEIEQVRQGTQQIADIHPFALKTNLLAKNANDAKLVQLINDTLAYGAAAQKAKNYNADAPVTDGVEGFAPSQNVPTDQTVVENNTDETAKIESYEVIVGKVAYFRFAIKLATFDGITIRVNGEEISLDHLVVKGGGDYVLLSEGLIMGLDSPDFTVEILKDGVSVSKVATGVGACANEVASTEQKNLLIAIYNLLASTQAYLWG